jgi:hypothetical protein
MDETGLDDRYFNSAWVLAPKKYKHRPENIMSVYREHFTIIIFVIADGRHLPIRWIQKGQCPILLSVMIACYHVRMLGGVIGGFPNESTVQRMMTGATKDADLYGSCMICCLIFCFFSLFCS